MMKMMTIVSIFFEAVLNLRKRINESKTIKLGLTQVSSNAKA